MKLRPIDDAETEKLVDTGDRVLILELRQPSVGDVKLFILAIFRDGAAKFLNLSRSDSKAIPKLSKLVPWTQDGLRKLAHFGNT